MKAILLLAALLTCSFCLSQEIRFEDVKDNTYVLENAYHYGNISGVDTAYLKIQFTAGKFMKIVFPGERQYVFIDVEAGFMAMKDGEEDPSLKKFHEEETSYLAESATELKKVDTITFKGYNCDVYHFFDGTDLLAFYIEQGEGTSFNGILASFFSEVKGIPIRAASFPKGRIIAGMELKDGAPKDLIELIEAKENLEISFTLKTSE